ncbi:hypothetical protein SAMN04487912_105347 [Arthrobacter sp. cf158]|uniref:hypothetical protein n=1 Tax=Arthrobacter sp. cf158 TaxID=1761744 RepID=UPI0008967B7C|nr:hypothetical protein [Arthrobacter sp. cf158]SDW91466.1 hypothetical protein SAMN04487912_105347 [Arthrobacter sp. cf158]
MSITDIWGASWVLAVNADRENRHIGRMSRFMLRFELEDGEHADFLYAAGTLSFASADPTGEDLLHIAGGAAAWAELSDANAAPRRHDLLALLKAPQGLEVVDGHDILLRHLRVITRLVEIGKKDAKA